MNFFGSFQRLYIIFFVLTSFENSSSIINFFLLNKKYPEFKNFLSFYYLFIETFKIIFIKIIIIILFIYFFAYNQQIFFNFSISLKSFEFSSILLFLKKKILKYNEESYIKCSSIYIKNTHCVFTDSVFERGFITYCNISKTFDYFLAIPKHKMGRKVVFRANS